MKEKRKYDGSLHVKKDMYVNLNIHYTALCYLETIFFFFIYGVLIENKKVAALRKLQSKIFCD